MQGKKSISFQSISPQNDTIVMAGWLYFWHIRHNSFFDNLLINIFFKGKGLPLAWNIKAPDGTPLTSIRGNYASKWPSLQT